LDPQRRIKQRAMFARVRETHDHRMSRHDDARSLRRVVFLDGMLLFRLRDGDLELSADLGDRLAQ